MNVKSRAEAVIIGGGITGCAFAYYLSKAGLDVVLVEQGYLASGATGRCDGGIRQQFGAKRRELIAIGRESLKIFETLDEELNCETQFTQKGYLLPIVAEEELNAYEENMRVQRSLGVDVKFLEPDEIKDLEPLLDVDGVGIIGASFCQEDGTADPFLVTYGYAKAAKELGAHICTHTRVKNIKTSDGKIESVKTSCGEIRTNLIVNAAGGHSSDIAKMAGIQLPNLTLAEEELATEALKPTLNTLTYARNTSSRSPGIFIHQTKRGEILGPGLMRLGHETSSTYSVLEGARRLAKYFPALRHVNILRTWTGLQDYTPDTMPILGSTDNSETLIQCNGLSGLGFMLAPLCAKLLSEMIVNGKPSMMSELIESLNLRRFEGKQPLTEKMWLTGEYQAETKSPLAI